MESREWHRQNAEVKASPESEPQEVFTKANFTIPRQKEKRYILMEDDDDQDTPEADESPPNVC